MPISKASGQAVAPAAKGDLVVGSATNDAAVLGVGSTDQVLTVDSSTATGLKWATPSAGGMTLISETVASANSSLSLSSIPGTYKQLLLLWSGIYHSATGTSFSVRFNNNSGTDYSEIFMRGTATSLQTNSALGSSISEASLFGYQQTSTSIQNLVSGYLLVDNYASTTKHKYYEYSTGFRNVGAAEIWRYSGSGFWEETAAITSLDIVRPSGTATFSNSTNTSIRLYGVS